MFMRVFSAMVGLAILLAILFSGGMVFYISAFVVTVLGLYEFNRSQNNHLYFLVINSLCVAAMMMSQISLKSDYLFPILVVYVLSLLMGSLLLKIELRVATTASFGLLYVGFLMLTILEINRLDPRFIWYIFLVSFLTDTFAFFSGTYFGKNKLIPEISPKKTVEGAIGGVLGCLLSGVVYSLMFFPELVYTTIPLVAIGSIAGQFGDLIASKFKREAAIKDFGTIMPGHGGMLDRFDSILFVAPVIYIYLLFIK